MENQITRVFEDKNYKIYKRGKEEKDREKKFFLFNKITQESGEEFSTLLRAKKYLQTRYKKEPISTMTVRDLIQELTKIDYDKKVILATDPEMNSFSTIDRSFSLGIINNFLVVIPFEENIEEDIIYG